MEKDHSRAVPNRVVAAHFSCVFWELMRTSAYKPVSVGKRNIATCRSYLKCKSTGQRGRGYTSLNWELAAFSKPTSPVIYLFIFYKVYNPKITLSVMNMWTQVWEISMLLLLEISISHRQTTALGSLKHKMLDMHAFCFRISAKEVQCDEPTLPPAGTVSFAFSCLSVSFSHSLWIKKLGIFLELNETQRKRIKVFNVHMSRDVTGIWRGHQQQQQHFVWCEENSGRWYTVQWNTESGFVILSIFSTRPEHRDVVRPQVLLRHQTGGVAHEVMTSKGLREGDHVPDAGSPDDDGHQPVQTWKEDNKWQICYENTQNTFTACYRIFNIGWKFFVFFWVMDGKMGTQFYFDFRVLRRVAVLPSNLCQTINFSLEHDRGWYGEISSEKSFTHNCCVMTLFFF